jgi:hypothetical protein
VGVGVLGDDDPQPLIVIVTPLSMAIAAASVNSRRSSRGSSFIASPRSVDLRVTASCGSKRRAAGKREKSAPGAAARGRARFRDR